LRGQDKEFEENGSLRIAIVQLSFSHIKASPILLRQILKKIRNDWFEKSVLKKICLEKIPLMLNKSVMLNLFQQLPSHAKHPQIRNPATPQIRKSAIQQIRNSATPRFYHRHLKPNSLQPK